MSTSLPYTVEVWAYAERHFINDFSKKYSKAWQITLEVIFHSLYRIDQLLLTSKAEIITSCPSWMLIKCEFTVAGSNISAHASGNRYIIYQDQQTKVISILLLYAKTHVRKNQQETIRRKQEIKSNYPFIKNLFPEL